MYLWRTIVRIYDGSFNKLRTIEVHLTVIYKKIKLAFSLAYKSYSFIKWVFIIIHSLTIFVVYNLLLSSSLLFRSFGVDKNKYCIVHRNVPLLGNHNFFYVGFKMLSKILRKIIINENCNFKIPILNMWKFLFCVSINNVNQRYEFINYTRVYLLNPRSYFQDNIPPLLV